MALILRILLILLTLCLATTHELNKEEFHEELLLKPLSDRKILSHFHFRHTLPDVTHSHHSLFPKAVFQLVQKFRVRELELSFTQGRWNYERWGGYDPLSSSNAKPPGVELWAIFDVPQHEVDASWKNLTHTLSGLFCASINFLESSTEYSAPEWGSQQSSGKLRYGALPREAVCTENLTPWLKLLPCRDKAGLAALMDRPSIYRGYYHSQRLHLTSSEFGAVGSTTGIVLDQTLTLVLQPDKETGSMYSGSSIYQPNWSMSSLFGREVGGKCVLAESSTVFVLLEGGLVSTLKNTWREKEGHEADNIVVENSWSNPNFELSIPPNKVIEEVTTLHKNPSILYEYSVEDSEASKPFDLEFRWKNPVAWSSPKAPLSASRFLTGSGNERGAIAISLESSGRKDEKPQSLGDFVEKMRVSPSEDKVSPGVMEMILRLPCAVNSAALTIDFDKGFLHIDEYPPDANQGFDIPSAIVSFPDFQTKIDFLVGNSSKKSPMISKLQESRNIQSYTEVLLVPLTTPDFSMPYNVITITCTVFALYFGSLLNALRRRVAEEERHQREIAAKKTVRFPLLFKLLAMLRGQTWEQPPSQSSTSTSLINTKIVIKVIIVAGIAAGWQYYYG
ncbi:GPI transamidase component PIG-T [Heracleum sosnowskyi]|uniref:GPI transamidase component PIG-T n=1 Tax=Heracleum sosnowskyi TaxID=360622 RepID=A0AAD8GXV6_9APIA|nr:GPI transamidase component PIG-T [Heracleum sosnowskyi]